MGKKWQKSERKSKNQFHYKHVSPVNIVACFLKRQLYSENNRKLTTVLNYVETL